ncbi:MAG: hypothetical protein PVJ42_00920 [bacterium]|jgi:hypothetical protein
MIKNREFRRIYIIQILLAVADAMGMNFMMLYLVTTGFSLEQILLATTLAFFTPVVLIALMRRARAKVSFLIAFAAKITCYATALLWLKDSTISLIYISNALVLVFFWIPYNVEFFSYVGEKSKAYMGSLAVAVYPLVGLLIPPVAALIWRTRGFDYNMIAAVAILGTGAAYVLLNRAIRFRAFDYSISVSLRRLKRYRLLFFLQGFWEASVFVGIPAFTLLFIRTEVRLGIFLSYLGVLSVLATIALARLSDRTSRRTAFLYPTVLLAGCATLALALARSFPVWIGVAGLVNFSNVMAIPFLTSVALDADVTGIDMWAGRELLLNFGRAAGSGILLVTYTYWHDYRPGFLILGAALLLYAGMIHVKRIYVRAPIVPSQPAR